LDGSDIGIIGMGVMGQSFALNIESRGFTVSVYNRTESRTREFVEKRAKGKAVVPTYSLRDFVYSLKVPRKVLLMVKAGEAVDEFLRMLKELLEKNDIIIDGGNSYFKDTERRSDWMRREGIFYLGTGISGGEYGALYGPCIMPGGDKEAYQQVEEIFLKACAYTEDGPCCSYLGPGSAGHFVKMVHNGIEYAMMEIIAESYHLMRDGLLMDIEDIQDTFEEWNKSELNSYLVEITGRILEKRDKVTEKPLVDLILDKAGQKGTGLWTSKVSLDLGVPVPTINGAVNTRIISGFKEDRAKLSDKLRGSLIHNGREDKDNFISLLRRCCYVCMLLSYTQGMHLLKVASEKFNYNLNLSEVARIWKGGCIIRARVLDTIKNIYVKEQNLPNLIFSDELTGILNEQISALRHILIKAVTWGIPVPAMSACLNYYDSYRAKILPANLIQAQRDYFGAHKYERVDKKGFFHTEWQKIG